MKKTLVIYDNTGKIFFQNTDNYVVPEGLQHLELEIPDKKYLISIDVSGEVHEPIYEDEPKSETERLQEELDQTKLALAELAEALLGGA